MPAPARTAVDYELLWHGFERHMKLLLESSTVQLCRAEGDTINGYARIALTLQGKWFAIQDVLGLMDQLKEQERDGSLAQENDDAPD